jgi:putative ATP-dependent endonuclease of OLD family
MYLSRIQLWNFRKYGAAGFDRTKPSLTVQFSPGVNVLIGPNDAGKTAIVDAIRIVLGTNSVEWARLASEDFHTGAERLRIELRFEGLTKPEGKNFTEWIEWVDTVDGPRSFLTVFCEVVQKAGAVLPYDVRAGAGSEGHRLDAEAKELLRVTYLKPLRDAKSELVARRNSRLSQILLGHAAFKGQEKSHKLTTLFKAFNAQVGAYFSGEDTDGEALSDQNGKILKAQIEAYLKSFTDQQTAVRIGVSEDDDLRQILATLGMSIADVVNPGLGSLNRMFMSAELVHVAKNEWTGLRLALIEELEAHLHPQAQMKVIHGLQGNPDQQIILTTHSPNLASKVPLKSLILLNGTNAYPLGNAPDGSSYTGLDDDDQQFLEWFLDVTKSNLFFAKGLIMVEGWSEEILWPALASKMKQQRLISQDLTEAGVSVVNVGGTSQLRYARIFLRAYGPQIDVPVSVVTDVDMPVSRLQRLPTERAAKAVAAKAEKLRKKFDEQSVRAFVAPEWTLEYCLHKSSSLSNSFKAAAIAVHPSLGKGDFESKLVQMLSKRRLSKVAIAARVAKTIMEDSHSPNPKLVLCETDVHIKYMLDSIKHAIGAEG